MNMKMRLSLTLLLASIVLAQAGKKLATVHGGNGISLPPPPPAKVAPVKEEFGEKTVTDPYRWLEDSKSPETRAWIDSQMRYTEKYLSQVKNRPEIAKRLTELLRIESFSIPVERNGNYFFTKRLAEENQSSIYLRKGLQGSDERLIDATKLSADQNTSVTIADISEDASLLVYGVRDGGADEQSVHVFDVNARHDLSDVLPRARYSGIDLSPDKKGIYYSKVEPAGTRVFFHPLGGEVSADKLVFGEMYNYELLGPMQLISTEVTENGRYLLITVAHGVPPTRVDVYAQELDEPDQKVRPIIHAMDNRFSVVNYEGDLYALTDNEAPNYRVVKISIDDPHPSRWKTIVPEGKDVISSISIVGGKLFLSGLHDVVTQTRIFTLDGRQTGEITYPAIGSATNVHGRGVSNDGFYSFESFNIPPTIYHYDVASGKAGIFAKPQVPFASDDYEVQQVFYNSKDGTRIPMFISSKKGVKRDGVAKALIFRLRRIQREHPADMESRVRLVDGTGRLFRATESPWRRRVRRSLAQGGHVREKAKRLRRFVRRGAVPH